MTLTCLLRLALERCEKINDGKSRLREQLAKAEADCEVLRDCHRMEMEQAKAEMEGVREELERSREREQNSTREFEQLRSRVITPDQTQNVHLHLGPQIKVVSLPSPPPSTGIGARTWMFDASNLSQPVASVLSRNVDSLPQAMQGRTEATGLERTHIVKYELNLSSDETNQLHLSNQDGVVVIISDDEVDVVPSFGTSSERPERVTLPGKFVETRKYGSSVIVDKATLTEFSTPTRKRGWSLQLISDEDDLDEGDERLFPKRRVRSNHSRSGRTSGKQSNHRRDTDDEEYIDDHVSSSPNAATEKYASGTRSHGQTQTQSSKRVEESVKKGSSQVQWRDDNKQNMPGKRAANFQFPLSDKFLIAYITF
ncbi:hypothetical protein M427DRAFT_435602 [Gonapodya prolifera JEL478]|uniref:Uncharacterized protein n=1 Tax=Gonapodya prolifera (strain JEL478) TaxID=1344416 RepID=A0A139A5A8_GONPJ|nr:hypothetical protein M427DRAFT_435602 [Gonapodya prolifera JEL478]|eukprot:KXS11573.1 hypothetical protein M427DRAFT_435602 [Gonapodya prolifera JEL478]